MHEKVFSEGEKFLAVKFNAKKKFAVKISSSENSGEGIRHGENSMRLNFRRQNFCKISCGEIKRGENFTR